MRIRSGVGLFVRSEAVILAVFAVVAALIVTLPGRANADFYVDDMFTTETVATFDPYTLVGMAFAPDGRMFVWQKNGTVRIVKNGVVEPTPFLDFSAKVNTVGDRGMWGLAFDPDFTSNGYIYLTYVFENTSNTTDTSAKTARLVRVQADPANPDVMLPGSETVILGSVGTPPCEWQPAGSDCIGADSNAHTLGEILFLPDGTMLVGNGDGSDGGFADPLSLRAQDLNSFNGKILRINRDGTAVPDNPFYDGTNSVQSKVWLYGVRNPFRFSLNPVTGDVWFGDVGWNTWEEIDQGARGANYGWPCFEGNGPAPGYSDMPVCQALSPAAVTLPYYTYNHVDQGDGKDHGSTAIGGPFYTGTAYPEQYRGNFFFCDYAGNWIKRVVFDDAGHPTSVENFAYFVHDPIGLVQGPDGLIYYLSFPDGAVRRIRYDGPAAVANANPAYGHSPLTVNFSSVGSAAPGGGSLTYHWDFGDGTESTEANPSHVYASLSVSHFTATLTVTDVNEQTSTSTVDVTVGSLPPVPTISMPINGTRVQPGDTVNYSGGATDVDDGPIASDHLKWTVLLHHNTHIHTFVGSTGASGSFVVEDHGPIGTFSYEVILTATDSSGLKGTASVTLPVGPDLQPPTIPMGVTATPSAAAISVGWNASTDNDGVTGYVVQRCQGDGCTSFAQVATPSTPGYTDNDVLASTTYRYRVAAGDAAGNMSDFSAPVSATVPDAPAVAGTFVSLTPSRILDTRKGVGAPMVAIAASHEVELQVTGQGGVPDTGVGAVVLNVTAVQPTAGGHVTVYPSGTERPLASNLNFIAGQIIANLVTVKIGDGGRVSLYNGSGGAVHLVADVSGYYRSGLASQPGTFTPLDPSRILDTRHEIGAPPGPVAPRQFIDVQVTGQGGVPASGVGAVVMNVTVTAPTGGGHVTAFPSGTERPLASNLNFEIGQTIPNLVTVQVGANGKVSLYNGTGGTVHLLADVAGYYRSGTPTAPGAFVSTAPVRILDTRNGNGIGGTAATVPGNGSIDLQVTGRADIPSTHVGAVVLNTTVTAPTQNGWIVVYPAGSPLVLASNVNFVIGQTIPNLVMVKLGDGGQVTLHNGTSGPTHLLADVAGYFLS